MLHKNLVTSQKIILLNAENQKLLMSTDETIVSLTPLPGRLNTY